MPIKLNHSIVKIAIGLVFVLLILLAGVINQNANSGNDDNAATTNGLNELPVEDLVKFSNIYQYLKKGYVNDIDDKTMIDNAISGMLLNLDPYSQYLKPEKYEKFQEKTSGKFGGLGMQVQMNEDGFVLVVSPIDDTPAYHAGIKPGDLILRLDDTPVKGLTLNEAVGIMRGDPGTDITLTIYRKGESGTIKETLTRDIIKVTSVRKRRLSEDMGYIRISTFQERTTADLAKSITEFDENGSLKGLILDLRNNPGGRLDAAVGVSDVFLNQGSVVSVKGRDQVIREEYKAKHGDVLKNRPLIVMINEGSASASEIVAGALQDHKRAVIIGRTSFGKATVQTIFKLSDGSAIKFTTAHYYTPNNRSIQGKGIVPDIEVDVLDVKRNQSDLKEVKEADLKKSIPNPDDKEKAAVLAKELGEDAEKKAEATPELKLSEQDYELYEATQILKAMILTKGD